MKVNCIYHREQLITNFCRDIHCLMPLCPQCISQHTNYHQQERTRPQYATIYEILADVHTQVTNCMEELERDKLRNGNLMINIQTVSDKVKQKIKIARQMAYQAIDDSFSMLEKDINKQLDKFHQEKSIYSLSKSQRQDKLILQHLDQLSMIKNTLKTDRGLSNIIFFLRQKHFQIENFHNEFSTYLNTNQSYNPKIQINNQALHSLDSVISRLVKLGNTSTYVRRKTNEPLQEQSPNLSPIKYSVSKIKNKPNVPFVESHVRTYSPHKPGLSANKSKPFIKIDEQYQKVSRKVALLRQNNHKLSRLLVSEHKG